MSLHQTLADVRLEILKTLTEANSTTSSSSKSKAKASEIKVEDIIKKNRGKRSELKVFKSESEAYYAGKKQQFDDLEKTDKGSNWLDEYNKSMLDQQNRDKKLKKHRLSEEDVFKKYQTNTNTSDEDANYNKSDKNNKKKNQRESDDDIRKKKDKKKKKIVRLMTP